MTRKSFGLLFFAIFFLTGCSGSFQNLGLTSTITSVSVSCNQSSVQPGQTSQCSATVAGTGNFSQAITWSATSGTISSTGIYTAPASAPAAGSDTIKAVSTQDSSKSGSAKITIASAAIEPAVTGVSVAVAPSDITTTQTSTCSANVSGTGAFSTAVTWSATGGVITQAGVLTPSGAGMATCVANAVQPGYTNVWGSGQITVAPPPASTGTVTSISAVAAPSSITTADTSTCSATVHGTGNFSTAVTWTATGGSITQGGVFTPSGTGTGSCIAHSAQTGYTGVTGSASVTITPSSSTVTGITVVAAPSSITTAQTSACSATVTGTGAFSKAVTWTATGGSISAGGLLTPSGTGNATCVAHSAQAGYTNLSGAANIAVTAAPFTITAIKVLASPSSITTNQTSTCGATVSGTGVFSSLVNWTATGGTITSGGVFTPTGAGTATCTASSAVLGFTNISASANIAVAAAAPAITGVTLICTSATITDAQTTTCTPTVSGTGAFTNTVNLAVNPAADGTLSASTDVTSGTAVTFTPPTTGAETATISATSTEDSTKVGTFIVNVTVPGATASCGGMSLGNEASLNGFIPFPTSNAWNTDISAAPLDPNSSAIINGNEFTGDHLHPDFSSIAGGDYGMPYVVVDSSTTPVVPINVVAYAGNSDVADAPFPITAPIEGAPADCTGGPNNYVGDAHVVLLDRHSCMLYETFNTTRCNGAWSSDSETIWDMQNYDSRPWGWTSADAAGLPIFPGLVRYDEVAAGAINHAIRFTMQNTLSDNNGGYFVEPATHAAGTSSVSQNVMGLRIRLKASFDISSFSAANQVILTAMKKYGLILADNGGDMFFQGDPDARWNDDDLSNLSSVTAANFEVVQMTPTYPGWDAASAPAGAAPTINSFTASSSTVAAGTPVTLTWTTTNDTYDFIDKLGGVRGGTVTVTPTVTTTYTLNATNHYGRATQPVTVVVQ